MLLSTTPCSILTKSRRATSGARWDEVERTRRPSRASGLKRLASRQLKHDLHILLVRRHMEDTTVRPPTAICTVSEIVSALMPCKAAFSLSTTTAPWAAPPRYTNPCRPPLSLAKNVNHLVRQAQPIVVVGAVHFGHQSLQHGRPRRHFRNGNSAPYCAAMAATLGRIRLATS